MAQEMEILTADGEVISGVPMAAGGAGAYGGVEATLAVSLARVEIDHQIATARAMPRSIQRAVQNIMTLATLDEETAEECIYSLPRGGKPIIGPSARFAEIISSQWGNSRVASRVVTVDRFEKFVEAEAVFHDLETNAIRTARVRRRIVDNKGRVFNDDMIQVTGNAASSIAARNVVLASVPKAVWRKAYASVEQVLRGDVKTLGERREKAMKAFAAFGVKPDQVFVALGVAGIEDITLDHMTVLTGMHSTLKSGEATVEAMFPREPAAGEAKPLGEKMDALAGSKEEQKTTAPEPEQKQAAKKEKAEPAKTTAKAEPAKAKADPAPAKTEAPQQTRAEPEQSVPEDPRAAEFREAMDAQFGKAAPVQQAEPERAQAAAAAPAQADPDPVDPNDGDDEMAELLERLDHSPRGIDADDPAQLRSYLDGIAAREEGIPKKLLPAEVRGRSEDAAAAWRLGWDYAHGLAQGG